MQRKARLIFFHSLCSCKALTQRTHGFSREVIPSTPSLWFDVMNNARSTYIYIGCLEIGYIKMWQTYVDFGPQFLDNRRQWLNFQWQKPLGFACSVHPTGKFSPWSYINVNIVKKSLLFLAMQPVVRSKMERKQNPLSSHRPSLPWTCDHKIGQRPWLVNKMWLMQSHLLAFVAKPMENW